MNVSTFQAVVLGVFCNTSVVLETDKMKQKVQIKKDRMDDRNRNGK